MKSLEGFERVTLAYDKPIPISKKAFQIFHNINGSTRAVNDQGVIIIQTKKLKGKSREVARIKQSKMENDNFVREFASQVSKTVLEVQDSFETLSIIQKKHLIRRFIHRIIVDRDAVKVRAYIRVIPKL
jgi:hypothetical protein